MAASNSNQANYQNQSERLGPWQEKLQEHCVTNKIRAPIYSIASDRRGGRTAWSCTVEVGGLTVPAKYWYDGQYVYNAKEDAANTGLEALQKVQAAQQAQYQQQQQSQQQSQQPNWGYTNQR